MIVTLGRQCGCAGDEVGKKLSELLGIPFYTKPELIALAKEDPNIELMTGDLGFGVLKPFWEQLPDQFVNAGIAEQNMT